MVNKAQEPKDGSGKDGARGGRAWVPDRPLTDDRAWSVNEVAYFLGVCSTAVRNLERTRDLPSLPRIGTRITFAPAVVRAFRDGWRPARASAA